MASLLGYLQNHRYQLAFIAFLFGYFFEISFLVYLTSMLILLQIFFWFLHKPNVFPFAEIFFPLLRIILPVMWVTCYNATSQHWFGDSVARMSGVFRTLT